MYSIFRKRSYITIDIQPTGSHLCFSKLESLVPADYTTRAMFAVTTRNSALKCLIKGNAHACNALLAFSSRSGGSPTGPLVGIRVLDLGQVVAGNFCGALLSYFGADVIKVEPPGRGDALRHLRELDASGDSLWWKTYGRNRRCMTIDLHHERGRNIVRKLAEKADILVENFRPGVMEKWGLGPEDLNKELIFTRISGYGQTGVKAAWPGYASVCEAAGGLRYLNGFADRAPVRPNISLGDSLAGLHAAFGAVMALHHRGKSGRGQVVDTAITESIFNMLEGCVPEYFESGIVRPPSGSTLTGVVPSGTWKSRDEKWVVIGGNGNSVYSRLIAAIGRPDMGLENPKFSTDSARCRNEDELVDVIEAWVASHTAEEVMMAMNQARVPAGPIYSIADIAADKQFKSRGMFEKVSPPGKNKEAQMTVVPALAPKLSETPGSTRWAGPALGQHTSEILKEDLGLTDAEIEDLRACSAI